MAIPIDIDKCLSECKEAGIDVSGYDEIFCFCGCHADGFDLIHCIPCCQLCYKKYIDMNGDLDVSRLKVLLSDYEEKIKIKKEKDERRELHKAYRESLKRGSRK